MDCDLVARKAEAGRMENILAAEGYARAGTEKIPYQHFVRLEKKLSEGMSASIDLLLDSVHDRQSGAVFPFEWLFSRSALRRLPGKTVPESAEVRILDPDALFVMKFVCARPSDVRDAFMLSDRLGDLSAAKAEISSKTDFGKQHDAIFGKVSGGEFKKNLEGVFGYVERTAFEKRLGILQKLGRA
jgi:hypothetical protein